MTHAVYATAVAGTRLTFHRAERSASWPSGSASTPAVQPRTCRRSTAMD